VDQYIDFVIIAKCTPVAQVREAGEARAKHGFEGLAVLARQRKIEFKIVFDLLKL
jgi:hypothetical protein